MEKNPFELNIRRRKPAKTERGTIDHMLGVLKKGHAVAARVELLEKYPNCPEGIPEDEREILLKAVLEARAKVLQKKQTAVGAGLRQDDFDALEALLQKSIA